MAETGVVSSSPKMWYQSRGITGSLATIVVAGIMLVSVLVGHYKGEGELPPMTYDTGIAVVKQVEAEKSDTEALIISMLGVFAGWRALSGRISANSKVRFLRKE